MFDRFTDKAQKLLAVSRKEALRFNHDFIGTEHLLLGMIMKNTCAAAIILKHFGVETDTIRREIEKRMRPGPPLHAPPGELPFTPRAKKVLELSMQESTELGCNHIGTGHVLLGILRQKNSAAAQVLTSVGLKLEETRTQILRVTGADPSMEMDPE